MDTTAQQQELLRNQYMQQRGAPNTTPVNRTLIKLLEAAKEGVEGKKLAKLIRPTDRFLAFGGVHSAAEIREYLTTEDLEGTDLVVEEVAGTIYGGMQYKLKLRGKGIFPEQTTKSNSFRWTTGEAGLGPAAEIAEGAEVPDEKEDFSKVDFTIKKYGSKARITTEMIDDSLFNIVEREIFNLGQRLGLRYDALIMQKLIDDGTNEHDATGSNLDSSAVRSTIAKLRGEPTYPCTHVILHPEWMTKLLNDSAVTYSLNYGAINPTLQQVVPKLYGADIIEFDYGTTDATQTYGWAADGEIGGVAVHAPLALGVGINRELRIEKYKDPVKDLVGMVGTTRFDTNVLFGAAIARAEY